MSVAVSVPPLPYTRRRSLLLLGALLLLYIVMPWAVRPLERVLTPGAAAVVGQIAEAGLGLALGVWVLALVRRERRRARAYASELERLTLRDVATGLGNQHAFRHDLDVALSRARRTCLPVTVVCLDVDHFDLLNLCHGRRTGDHTLRTLGAVIRSSARFGCDAGYRIGDDEFAMVLEADRPSSETVTRRVEWNFRERSPRKSSVSTGIVTWDGRATPHELLQQARRALKSRRHAPGAMHLA